MMKVPTPRSSTSPGARCRSLRRFLLRSWPDTIVRTVELGVRITDAAVDGELTVLWCDLLTDGPASPRTVGSGAARQHRSAGRTPRSPATTHDRGSRDVAATPARDDHAGRATGAAGPGFTRPTTSSVAATVPPGQGAQQQGISDPTRMPASSSRSPTSIPSEPSRITSIVLRLAQRDAAERPPAEPFSHARVVGLQSPLDSLEPAPVVVTDMAPRFVRVRRSASTPT